MHFKNGLVLLKNFPSTLAFGPSSSTVIHHLIRSMNLSKGKIIVELGGGTGRITRAILESMDDDARLFSFEINDELYEDLKTIEDPRLVVVNGSAEDLSRHLSVHGVKEVDYVVSALPILVMPSDVIIRIFQEVKALLNEGGKLIHIQYHLQAYRWLKKVFDTVRVKIVFFNLPPAFLYYCSK